MKSTIDSTSTSLHRRSLFKLSAGSLLATWLATPLGNIFAQTSAASSPAPARLARTPFLPCLTLTTR